MSTAESFLIFWSEYPRHEARKDGLKAWLKLNPSPDLFGRIIGDLVLRKQSVWFGKEKCYIPLPGSYLRGERWEDEIDEIGPESISDRIARENREGAIEFDKQLFGPSWNGFEPKTNK